jgi:hypothetical protein
MEKSFKHVLFLKSDDIQPDLIKDLENLSIKPHIFKLLTFQYSNHEEELLHRLERAADYQG